MVPAAKGIQAPPRPPRYPCASAAEIEAPRAPSITMEISNFFILASYYKEFRELHMPHITLTPIESLGLTLEA